MRPLADCADEVMRCLRTAETVFCFLDYDGTLAWLTPTPEEAEPLPGTTDLLRALTAAPGTRIAIISGRPIAEIRHFIDLPGLYYAGVHGIELEWPTGARRFAKGIATTRRVMATIKRRLERSLTERPHIVIEDKGAALACHYRRASHADAVMVRRVLADIVHFYRRRGRSLTVMHGNAISELLPGRISKGEAVRAFLASCPRQTLSVYVGDDRTDAEAFAVLPPEAITIHVGGTQKSVPARFCLPRPIEVQRFLRDLLTCRLSRIGPMTARAESEG